MQKTTLRKRDLYLNRIIAFQDTEMIKVMTGIRRCGKSSLMKLMAEHLRDTGVTDDQIIEMNFESMSIPDMDARGFYEYVKARICPDKRTYLFFDEVQKVRGWENVVNSFRVDFDCDIYITGSKAYLLSSELSTYLSGRYVEIKVLPLSFKEFLEFHGYTLTERKSPAGGVRKRITDPVLLRKIILFLADNIGNNTSATSIGNILVNGAFWRMEPERQSLPYRQFRRISKL